MKFKIKKQLLHLGTYLFLSTPIMLVLYDKIYASVIGQLIVCGIIYMLTSVVVNKIYVEK